MYSGYLTGAGHFGWGFAFGAAIMVCLQAIRSEQLNVQLYAPFIPFGLGAWASLPYFWLDATSCSSSWLYNAFLFYDGLHCHPVANVILGRLNFVALICAAIYACIVWRYIRLVKQCRRNGWPAQDGE